MSSPNACALKEGLEREDFQMLPHVLTCAHMLAGSAGVPISSGRAGASGPAVQSHHPPPNVQAGQGDLHAAVPDSGLSSRAPHDQHLQVLLRESLQTLQSHQLSPEALAGQGSFHAAPL
jgi:hypothetical protein